MTAAGTLTRRKRTAIEVLRELRQPKVAVMLALPDTWLVATPVVPIVATAGFAELQVTVVVQSLVVPSL